MNPVVKVLADLDAILDTRLGLLDSIDPNGAHSVFHNEDYYFRLIDDFSQLGSVSKEVFKSAWKNRTTNILKRSIISPTIFVLKSMLVQAELKSINNPVAPKPSLIINTWPYALSPDEKDGIKKAIAHYSGVLTPIEMVHIPIHQFRLSRLKSDQYAAYFCYSFKDWLEGTLEELKTVNDPRLQIFIPSVFEQEGFEDEYDKIEMEVKPDPLKLMEGAFAEFFALDIMPTFMFSIYRPDKHDVWMEKAYQSVALPADQHPFIRMEDHLEDSIKESGDMKWDMNIQPVAPDENPV